MTRQEYRESLKDRMPVKMAISVDELRAMVVDQRMTDVAIAKQLGVCAVSVLHWRQRFKIARPHHKRTYAMALAGRGRRRKVFVSADHLREMYIDRGMTQAEIGKELSIGQNNVQYWMAEYGISARPRPGGRKTPFTEEQLRECYCDQGLNIKDTAAALGCTAIAVRAGVVRFGLQVDSKKTAKGTWRRKIVVTDGDPEHRYAHRGYIFLRRPDHPSADRDGYVPEHRIVVEEAMGRMAQPGEIIHHINLQKTDNRLENLAVLTTKDLHIEVHRYMERIAAHFCLDGPNPGALIFDQPVFWGGRCLDNIDLVTRFRLGAAARSESTSTETSPDKRAGVVIN